MVDESGSPVQLRCVNLSPWLDPVVYLLGKGGFRVLTTSSSEFKHRLDELVGASKAEEFWRQWTDHFVVESDFRQLKDRGFNCVRLPLNYRFIVGDTPGSDPTLNAAGIAPVDRAVAWGAAHGIYVILDLHVAPGGQNALPAVADVPSSDRVARLWAGTTAVLNQKMTVVLWQALAARYARASSIGGYDLLNEPSLPSGTPKSQLPALYKAIIAAIRIVDRSHMVILEGNNFAHDFSVLSPPPDNNVMYEFHEYAIFNREWNRPNQKALTPFLQLRADTQMPLWLGEFGEESLRWQSEMVQLMKTNQIGWAIWPWKRIELGNGHPIMQTIEPPAAWDELTKYLLRTRFSHKPSSAQAEQAMAQMLQAIRSEHCKENPAVADVLSGH